MRYIQKLPPVEVFHPIDGTHLEYVPHTKAMRIATSVAAQEGLCDVLELIDFRQRFEAAKELDWVPCEEPLQLVLVSQFKSAKTMGVGYALCAEAQIRAVVDAPSKAPAHINANGLLPDEASC
jgi:hypothetical protein